MKSRFYQAILCVSILLTGADYAFGQGQGPGLPHPPAGLPGGLPPGGPAGFPGSPSAPPNGAGPGGPRGTAPRPSVTSSTGVKLGPAGRWWDNKSVVQTVGLTRDQQKKMDAIFNANKPAIIQTYLTFEKEQTNTAALSKTPNVDQSKMFAAIDAVNQARAALEKANTQMLLQIRQQLAPAQLARLDAIP